MPAEQPTGLVEGSRLRPRGRRQIIMWALSGAVLAGSVWVIAHRVDTAAVRRAVDTVVSSPWSALPALAAFVAAFALRARLWCRILPGLSFRHAIAAIHVGLAANHLLPLRLGEGARAVSAARWGSVPLRSAVASTVVLRTADVLALAGLGWVFGPAALHGHLGWLAWAAPLVVAAALAVGILWMRSLPECRAGRLRLPDATVAAGTVAAWLLEAVLIWSSARWAGIPLSPSGAVVVTAASVVSQVAGIAPGGVGTYEAAAVAAYTALGYPAALGLAAAVVAHALTTAYSMVTGAVGLAVLRPFWTVRGPRLRLRTGGERDAALDSLLVEGTPR